MDWSRLRCDHDRGWIDIDHGTGRNGDYHRHGALGRWLHFVAAALALCIPGPAPKPFLAFSHSSTSRIVWSGGNILSLEVSTRDFASHAACVPTAMHASIFTLCSPTRKSSWRYLPVWNLAGSYWIQVGSCWILLCRKRTLQIYGSITSTAARSAMRSGSGSARRSGERNCLRACNFWLIDSPNSTVDPHLRSCRLSRICSHSENFIPHRYEIHRLRQSSQTKIARLAAREPRVWPLV